ncbi:MAG: NAD(P)-dependent alcohol dehydrogenase [Bacteroidia bacterium]
MKAVLIDEYGAPEVLKVQEKDIPEPGEKEVLVRVKAAAVNPVDYKVRQGKLRPLSGKADQKPLGSDFAGEVVRTGKKITRFGEGNAVFGIVRSLKGGAYAEYVTVPEDQLILKPDNISFNEAAGASMAALTALQGLRDEGKIKKGMKVLINGASGGVGSCAVQIAKHYGATVTGVCSTANLEMVMALGADEVIDYNKEDFSERKNTWDIIFDAVAKEGYTTCAPALASDGVYITTLPKPQAIVLQLLSKVLPGKSCKYFMMKPNHHDLDEVRALLEKGALKIPIAKTYPLNEISEAHKHSESGHANGKIIIEMPE